MDNEELEKLYMEALNADVPDYWDKIEAGIAKEKQPAKADIISFDAARAKKPEKAKLKTKHAGLIAAAVLMIAVAVPVLALGLGSRKKNDSKSLTYDSAESVSGDKADDAVMEEYEAAEATTEAATEAFVAEMAEMADEPTAGEESDEEDAHAAPAESESEEASADRNKESMGMQGKYTNSSASAVRGVPVVLTADIVQKGEKYIFTGISTTDKNVKIEHDEYEVENPDDLVKYMSENESGIKTWVCALNGSRVYVYGPAED